LSGNAALVGIAIEKQKSPLESKSIKKEVEYNAREKETS